MIGKIKLPFTLVGPFIYYNFTELFNVSVILTMTIEFIRKHALGLPGVTEDIKWEHNLCFSVGGKLFLITNPDDFPVSASFKTTDELFEELTAREGIMPAPYLAKNKWVMVADVSRIDAKEWYGFVENSYQLIFQKLPRKSQELIQS
jgi:predicted DNA-binding protein (MmcQ/YjbR family)